MKKDKCNDKLARFQLLLVEFEDGVLDYKNNTSDDASEKLEKARKNLVRMYHQAIHPK